MAEEQSANEKTEEATPQRREEFRKRGQVVQTRELNSVFILLLGALIIFGLSKFIYFQIWEIFRLSYGDKLIELIKNEDYFFVLQLIGKKGFLIVSPVLGISFILGVSASLLQIGFLYNEEAFRPKLEKINPFNGMKRIFSLKGLVEGIKSIAKVLLVGIILFLIFKNEILKVPFLIQSETIQIVYYLGNVVFKLLSGVAGFMLVVAGFDYFFQRWDLEKQMRMTKQEVKEEHKSREGDPLIRARIRKIQRELATKRMMEAVPKSDVIITNPTHLAIALKYDPLSMHAPKVVAKGADYVAEKIKKIAKEHDIVIVENKPLARTMYKSLKIGNFIPRELFSAVAEVLSYVYKIKRKVLK